MSQESAAKELQSLPHLLLNKIQVCWPSAIPYLFPVSVQLELSGVKRALPALRLLARSQP